MRFETKPMRLCPDGYYQHDNQNRWYFACRSRIGLDFALPHLSTPHQIVLVFSTEPVEGACETGRWKLFYAGAEALRAAGLCDMPWSTPLWWWVEIVREGK